MIRSIATIVITCIIQTCIAQVKIGYNAGVVNASAVLELGNNTAAAPSTWKSFIPPQVNFTNAVFTSTTVWGIAGTPTTGALVLNIGENYSNGFLGPGLYCWLKGAWCSMTTILPDKIRASLVVSTVAYDAAPVNTWVSVTAVEYNNLLTIVSGAARYAATEAFMTTVPLAAWTGGFTIALSNNAVKVPASSYIIAWSVRISTNASEATNSKLKISSSQTFGYTDYGSGLPAGTIPANTRVYYVMKKPSIITPAVPCYTAVYAALTGFLGFLNTSGQETFGIGDVSNAPSQNIGDSYSQVISTNVLQW